MVYYKESNMKEVSNRGNWGRKIRYIENKYKNSRSKSPLVINYKNDWNACKALLRGKCIT